ncbi:hypothetical protein MTR67_052352 [Solanum verrucosum]|uniref:Uncharacterized protein n=1 Tax=Solanum verrucosum TaxID=315347 RepID=A0AAF0ZZV2_SOLVR|nr:hypothetical protein MTR67_052352 [Solanum verrucosum]
MICAQLLHRCISFDQIDSKNCELPVV